MTINSLSTSSVSSLALSGLNEANQSITASTYRLSSGDRFYRAGDDVAALSISTRLQSDIVAGRQGLVNNLQAESLLQVAYGGLSEVNDILDDMKSIAVQANSGSLTATERAALDLQFQNLVGEIDSIASSTNFNGINLLDGTLSGTNDIETTAAASTAATGSLTFSSNLAHNNSIILNGALLQATTTNPTAGSTFLIGATISETVQNLASSLNQSTAFGLSEASYEAVGNSLQITSRAGGELSNGYTISQASSAAGAFTTAGDVTNLANVFTLAGGRDDAISRGGLTVRGDIGDNLINTQEQTAAEITITFVDNPADTDTVVFSNGNGGTITFDIVDTTANNLDAQRAATTEETMENLVDTITSYRDNSTANDTYVLDQLEFEIDGNNLVIRNRTSGNVLEIDGATDATGFAASGADAAISNTTLDNGVDTGVNLEGVTNADFIGTISGFSATYNSPDSITAQVTVGDSTYTADITDTTVTANTIARFNSSDGGFFDIQLAANNGTAVSDQGDADAFASRLNAAFSTLDIYQERAVDNFGGAGVFSGGTATVQLDDYTNARIDTVRVTAAPATNLDASIEVEVAGETFRSNNLGQSIGAGETFTLTSTEDASRVISITNGNSQVDLSNDADAETAQTDLRTSFGIGVAGSGGSGLTFQVGTSADNSISVDIGSATSSSLFEGISYDVTTQGNASDASDAVDAALDRLGSIIAEVGSTQAALQFNYNATNTAINELDTARGILADTDIATESTSYAAAIVQQQAAVSVLAQTQLLSSNLIGLIDN